MTDAIAVVVPGWRATDANDEPISGAKLKFYTAGTSTPKTVYSDYDLSVSLGPVVTCDSAGYPTSDGSTRVIVYTGTDAYKIVCTTSADVLVWSHDNVRGASITPAEDATAIPISPVSVKTSNYSIVVGDQGKLINAVSTSGNLTMTLPSAVTVGDGFEISIRHDGTANTVAIVTVSAQSIKGSGVSSVSRALRSRGETIKLVSDGADWSVAAYVPPLMQPNSALIKIVDRLTATPASPTPGARYIVVGTATGAWSTLGFAAGTVAEADGNGSWFGYTPQAGWFAFVEDELLFTVYKSGAWSDQTGMDEPSASTLKIGVFEHRENNGTGGGAPTTGAWTARTLNATSVNTLSSDSLASSSIPLPVGSYLVSATQKFSVASGSGLKMSAQQRIVAGTATIAAVTHGISGDVGATLTGGGIVYDPYTTFAPTDIWYVSVTVAGTIKLEYYTDGATSLGLASAEASGAAEIYARVTVLNLSSLQGPQGVQGDQGDGGLDAAYDYQWSTSTSGDPGTGKLGVNNATIASATAININRTTVSGAVISDVFTAWAAGTSTSKGTIRIAKEGTPQNMAVLRITGSGTNNGTYWTFPVTYVTNGGTLANLDSVSMLFVEKGDKGDTGNNGTTVPDLGSLTPFAAVLDRVNDGLVLWDDSASSTPLISADYLGLPVAATAFAATGDGSADDTAELNAALSSGYKVITGNGLTYKISSSITVPAGVTLRDATITTTTNTGINMILVNDGSRIENVTIVGSGTAGVTEHGIAPSVDYVDDVVITGVDVSNMTIAIHNWRSGLTTIAGGSRWKINGYIHDTIGTSSGYGYGVLIESGSGCEIDIRCVNVGRHALYLSAGAKNNRARVYSKGCQNFAVQFQAYTGQEECAHNHVEVWASDGTTATAGESGFASIVQKANHNTLIMHGTGNATTAKAVLVQGASGGPYPTGNIIIGSTVTGQFTGPYVFELENQDGTLITANRISAYATTGVIGLKRAGTNGVAHGGKVIGNFIDAQAQAIRGIYDEVNTVASLIAWNTIENNGGGTDIDDQSGGYACISAIAGQGTSTIGSIRARSETAIPAGGTAGAGFTLSSTSNFGVFFGSGAPTLSAAQGSLYMRSDGSSTSTRMYVNTNGTTGWTNVTTAT